MASRSLARPIIISVLYNLEQRASLESSPEPEDVIEYVMSEHSEGDVDRDFVVSVVDGVLKKKVILDEIISKAAPRWTHDMNMIDKSVLRAAIYELLFESDNVPAKVVISQAVSLADKFASPENRRFVNGVLGTIYREMEAGAQTGAEMSDALDNPDTEERVVEEHKVAASVFAKHDDTIWIALVHDVWGYWTFPKGSVQPGMTKPESCAYKVEEEIGIPVTIVEELGSNSYQPTQKSPKGKLVKHVTYFVATAQYQPLELTTSGGLDDVRWFPIGKIDKLHMYEDITQMVLKALPIIMQYQFPDYTN